jgi:hypothetical protein
MAPDYRLRTAGSSAERGLGPEVRSPKSGADLQAVQLLTAGSGVVISLAAVGGGADGSEGLLGVGSGCVGVGGAAAELLFRPKLFSGQRCAELTRLAPRDAAKTEAPR